VLPNTDLVFLFYSYIQLLLYSEKKNTFHFFQFVMSVLCTKYTNDFCFFTFEETFLILLWSASVDLANFSTINKW